jgi:hypothetical protein
MSQEKIERILATYKPVHNMPGYVWFDSESVIKLEILREVYEEEFRRKRTNKSSDNEGSSEDA